MSGCINKVVLLGNVGSDPEIRTTQDGKEIASFSLATNENWNDKVSGEKRTKTEWHRVVVFSPGIVNIIKSYVKKSYKIYIEGALQTRKWTDSNGVEKYTTEIILSGFSASIILLGGGNRNDSYDQTSQGYSNGSGGSARPSNNSNQGAAKVGFSDDMDDEIPF